MSKVDKTFDGSINISSNIKTNKKAIIGKFDLRDLVVIFIAVVVGIVIISILLVMLSFKNIFIIFIVLAVFEVPLISIGFMNIYNMKFIDYIKIKEKSNNKSYRKQIRKVKNNENKKKVDIYFLPLVVERKKFIDVLEEIKKIIYELKKYIKIENGYRLKVFNEKSILLVKVKESKDIDYQGLFRFFRLNRNIKYISNEDIKNHERYISSLRIICKKYNKKYLDKFNKEKTKIRNIGNDDNNKYYNLTKEILNREDDMYMKIMKIVLYKYSFDIEIIDSIKKYCDITINIDLIDKEESIESINFIDTFFNITGNEKEIKDKEIKITDILKESKILYKSIEEEKVRDSLYFTTENRY